MSLPLESYALLGDLHTAALVSRTGSIDWLCLPRFDSPAAFSALLGDAEHGCWRVAADGREECTHRSYVGDSLVLATTWEAPGGTARVLDFMPIRGRAPDVVRIVEGVSGRVEFTSSLRLRFDYGSARPTVARIDEGIRAVAGPNAAYVRTNAPVEQSDDAWTSQFAVSAGDRVAFVLTWSPSHEAAPERVDADRALDETLDYWQRWVERCTYDGGWHEPVVRSLITLRALTYEPTAGMVAAATTSLPEYLGGGRNWDYRFCWLRDATLTLHGLVYTGYDDEARRWRDWLLRALAGDPETLRIMYGLAGERRLPEQELGWLPGYAGSTPVRVGNQAAEQFQLDVFGEVLDAFHLDRSAGLTPTQDAWDVQRALLDELERRWREPDQGLWEMRGEPRHFVHSKVMSWVGFDRAVKAVEKFGLPGPADHWRKLRAEVHEEVCTKGFDAQQGAFTQSYGSPALDAATLLIPLTGFLPGDDPRVLGTIDAIGRELGRDGFLLRYDHELADDGFDHPEGAFLACTLWYAEALHAAGRIEQAEAVFRRVLDVRNDVGLLAEEYDVRAGRLVGNLPQAFSHVALVAAARALSGHGSRAGAS